MTHPNKSLEMLTKVSTMSVRVSPRVRYLAELAARESECSLTRYIENAIYRALSVDNSPHLLNEGLWDDNSALRLLLLVTARPDLLNDAERKTWRRIISSPDVFDKHGAVDRHKLSQQWNAINSQDGESL